MNAGAQSSVRKGSRARRPLRKDLQVGVFRRDHWLCHWCGRPVVFPPALRLLESFIRRGGHNGKLAYYHLNYRRDKAPLLDEQAAVVDHRQPHSQAGDDGADNLVTACNRCNMIKGDKRADTFIQGLRRHRVKGKHGEPVDWDGFTSLFIRLADEGDVVLTKSEEHWLCFLKGL